LRKIINPAPWKHGIRYAKLLFQAIIHSFGRMSLLGFGLQIFGQPLVDGCLIGIQFALARTAGFQANIEIPHPGIFTDGSKVASALLNYSSKGFFTFLAFIADMVGFFHSQHPFTYSLKPFGLKGMLLPGCWQFALRSAVFHNVNLLIKSKSCM
jgi:hypothetical protein